MHSPCHGGTPLETYQTLASNEVGLKFEAMEIGMMAAAEELPPLASGAGADKVATTSAHGVITMTIPKKAEAQAKRIAVTTKP
jgi:hypothetical protein